MITIKTNREIELMRRAGGILTQTLELVKGFMKPDITTAELDKVAEKFILKNSATPSFKNYHGFPASICVSINDEVVHGIPGIRRLKIGDIVSVDIGVCYDGYHADAARTFTIGKISPEAARLIEVTRESFYKGLKYASAGYRIGDISAAIQAFVEGNGYSVVRSLIGHGIGANLHEPPDVPNFGTEGKGTRLIPGMTLAIEPMVNIGTYNVKTAANGWTVSTVDGALSAHYENTVVIRKGEPDVLTGEN